jgi:hypothetical protein
MYDFTFSRWQIVSAEPLKKENIVSQQRTQMIEQREPY